MSKKKPLTRYYQIATARLRQNHIDEFHEILADVYKEHNVDVKVRGSREQQRQRRIERQKKLLKDLQS